MERVSPNFTSVEEETVCGGEGSGPDLSLWAPQHSDTVGANSVGCPGDCKLCIVSDELG